MMDIMEATEPRDLHRKIILYKNVEIQDGVPAMKGLDEKENFSFLKVRHDIVTITPIMREILEVARSEEAPLTTEQPPD